MVDMKKEAFFQMKGLYAVFITFEYFLGDRKKKHLRKKLSGSLGIGIHTEYHLVSTSCLLLVECISRSYERIP